MNGNGDSLQIEIPVIEVGNCRLAVGPHPQKPSLKCLTIGPLFLQLPLDDVARKTVIRGLTGVFMPDTKDDVA